MAAIDFPSSPTLNQQHSSDTKTWTWDGEKWLLSANDYSNQIADIQVSVAMQTS
jgi:hypothetical protein